MAVLSQMENRFTSKWGNIDLLMLHWKSSCAKTVAVRPCAATFQLTLCRQMTTEAPRVTHTHTHTEVFGLLWHSHHGALMLNKSHLSESYTWRILWTRWQIWLILNSSDPLSAGFRVSRHLTFYRNKLPPGQSLLYSLSSGAMDTVQTLSWFIHYVLKLNILSSLMPAPINIFQWYILIPNLYKTVERLWFRHLWQKLQRLLNKSITWQQVSRYLALFSVLRSFFTMMRISLFIGP